MQGRRDGGRTFASQDCASAVSLHHPGERWRRVAGKWPRTFGLRLQSGHAALLVVPLA